MDIHGNRVGVASVELPKKIYKILIVAEKQSQTLFSGSVFKETNSEEVPLQIVFVESVSSAITQLEKFPCFDVLVIIESGTVSELECVSVGSFVRIQLRNAITRMLFIRRTHQTSTDSKKLEELSIFSLFLQSESLDNFLESTIRLAARQSTYLLEMEMQIAEKERENLKLLQLLKKQQNKLLQTEKIGSLGYFTSTILHDIRNPVGAAKAATHNLHVSLMALLKNRYEMLAISGNDTEQILLLELLLMIVGSKREEISPEQQRKNKQDLKTYAKNHQIEFPPHLINFFARFSITIPQILPYLALLDKNEPGSFFDIVQKFNTVFSSLQIISLSQEVVENLVGTLQSYAQGSENEEQQPVEIAQQIETILSLFQAKFRNKITILREFQPIPPIIAFREELFQVWVNLILNGARAMDWQGFLQL